ncbi:MAG: hypothetical protein HDP28_02970 [Clostridia bacterium]|nr:hypothetical protein [Clostridia bacterium]
MKNKMTEKAIAEETEAKRRKQLAEEIRKDFESRKEARRSIEQGWRINMNFVSGNQYCFVSPAGNLETEDAEFYWQSRRCFNHIAPTVETRIARLSKVRPTLGVRAFSDEEADINAARLSSNILRSVKSRIDLDAVVARATLWSETLGTAFYKVVWNFDDGNIIGTDGTGHTVKEGDVNVVALSPFEIYPDSLTAEDMTEIRSLIHAKAVPVSEIFEKFGVKVEGKRIEEFSLVPYSSASGWKRPLDGDFRPYGENMEILIERYTRPSGKYPEGRLEIVAGDTLLFEGTLPYKNGDRGERVLPFIRQTSLSLAGSFFGTSVVDRMIPLQRAYNAVRNRKHEFLNRLTMGVITAEDGSVDAEELAENGLYPGKVLVYRQGSPAPAFLEAGSLPSEFAEEEERIAEEFILVSGMSEVSRNSANPTHVTSAVGLQLLIDQDTNRMHVSVESVERAIKEAGKQILHLYKQFAATKRLMRMTGTGGRAELFYFDASDISADDIEFETGYEKSPDEIREDILKLFELGLLKDEKEGFSDAMRNKLLDALGYGSFENARDISDLHLKKAERENIELKERGVEADSYDDHGLHIAEHTRALLSGGEEDGAYKERLLLHLAMHRSLSGEKPTENKKSEE